MKMTTLNEFLAEQLKDPEFKKEYERAKIEIEEEMRKEAENDRRESDRTDEGRG